MRSSEIYHNPFCGDSVLKHLKRNREADENWYKTSVFVPTFVMKITEYLCSGCFFSSDKFRPFNRPVLTEFYFNQAKGIVVLSLNLKLYSTCEYFFVKLQGFKDCHFG